MVRVMCNLDLHLNLRYVDNYTDSYYEYCKVKSETKSVRYETPVVTNKPK